jgi:Resolvase, N terminal domain
MLTVLGGLAEFERELIKARTGEGRKRAQARGVRFGRKLKPTLHQRQEALARREAGEALVDIGRSHNVSIQLFRGSPPDTPMMPQFLHTVCGHLSSPRHIVEVNWSVDRVGGRDTCLTYDRNRDASAWTISRSVHFAASRRLLPALARTPITISITNVRYSLVSDAIW